MITIAVEEVQQHTICVTLSDPDRAPFLKSSHDVNPAIPEHFRSSLSCVSSNFVPTLSSTSSPACSQLVSLPKNNIPPGVYTFLLYRCVRISTKIFQRIFLRVQYLSFPIALAWCVDIDCCLFRYVQGLYLSH